MRLLPLLALPLPLLLGWQALGQDRVLGGWASEAFARMAVTRQVSRWVSAEAPWGFADLMNHPGGRPFWPVDPAIQALAVPLLPVLGDGLTFTSLVIGLLVLAGLGVAAFARQLGASTLGAVLAGGLVQASPWVLTHAEDGILEVLAIGLVGLAAAAIHRALEQGRPGDYALVGLSVGLCAATGPYGAVYLALGCALSLPFWRSRRWVGVALASALACGLALAPFAWAERHESGRLGERYAESGFHLSPSPLVDASSGQAARRPRGSPERPPEGQEAQPQRKGPDAPWLRHVRRFPGGLAPFLGALFALLYARSRAVGALALLFWFGGTGPGVFLRGFGVEVPDPSGPLNSLLRSLPLLQSLGNPTRMLGVPALLGAVAAALLVSQRRAWIVPLAALGLGELWLSHPDLRLPATRLNLPEQVLAAVPGPAVVFPSGDPPAWQSGVSHGEALLYTAVAGVPGAYDYGVNGQAADLPWLLALSRAAAVPIGQDALRRQVTAGDFEALILLEDRLSPSQRQAARSWLQGQGACLAEGEGLSVWSLGSGG